MQIRVCSPLATFAYALAAEFEARCGASVSVSSTVELTGFHLHHRPGLPAAEVLRLMEVLKPIRPDILEDASLTGCDAVVTVAWTESLGEKTAYLAAESPEALAELRELVGMQLGFEVAGADIRYCHEAVMDVDAEVATPAWQVLSWMLQKKGYPVRANVLQRVSQGELLVRIPDPAKAALTLESRIGIVIRCDDSVMAEELKQRVQALGLSRVRTEAAFFNEVDESDAEQFKVLAGPLATRMDASHLPRLQILLTEFLASKGVDAQRFPLRIVNDLSWATESEAILFMPVRRALDGRMRAYDGPFPERFAVTILSDDPATAESLRDRLHTRGFVDINIAELSDHKRLAGFRLQWGAAATAPAVTQALVDEVSAAMAAMPAPAGMALDHGATFTDDDADIWIWLPVAGVADGRLQQDMSAPSRFTVKLHCPEPDTWQPLLDTLASRGFQIETPEVEDVKRPQLKYGAVAAGVVKQVCDAARQVLGADVTALRSFRAHDTDLSLFLPPANGKAEVPVADLEQWFPSVQDRADAAPGPFIEVQAERVRIGQVWLPRQPPPWHAFAPDANAFAHFCIDQPTAETLSHLALSVSLNEPCLLEGETSTSKTSSILFLASLLGQPVVRINLNGQTDTGELVGRFVPQHLSADLPVNLQEMQAGEHLLQPETRMILSLAETEGRRLSGLEVQQIMANEGMRTHPWRWQDGLVVQAMKKGWWVLRDEVNLAEPQILERMNSVLELDPYIVLTEHDNSVVGWGGTPVHAGFRIFATMNPAEYAGRSVLSPAYRDRWRGYRLVPKPSEAEYRTMLRRLVFGEQPALRMLGVPYAGFTDSAPFAQVAEHPHAGELLAALALFHAGLEKASSGGAQGAPRIGARRKERQVFTRRGLLSVVGYLARSIDHRTDATQAFREAVLRYYLGRVAEEERGTVVQLLDAAGIGPGTWRAGA